MLQATAYSLRSVRREAAWKNVEIPWVYRHPMSPWGSASQTTLRGEQHGPERHPEGETLRHEVARLIVWHVVSTRPVVPSAVSYEVWQQGNALSNALGQRTHSHPTGTRTARERCLCQHQAEKGRGWTGW